MSKLTDQRLLKIVHQLRDACFKVCEKNGLDIKDSKTFVRIFACMILQHFFKEVS